MSKFKLLTVAALMLSLSACSSESLDGDITSSGTNAEVRLHSWCDEGGAVTLDVEYGGPGNHSVVMVSPALAGSGIFDAVDEYESSHVLAGHLEAELIVEVLPTDGTCHVSITDRVSGGTLERSFDESDEDFTLTALVTQG